MPLTVDAFGRGVKKKQKIFGSIFWKFHEMVEIFKFSLMFMPMQKENH